ncbi:MAG: MATE family efflux transporter [Litoreibacter sp.]
MADLSQSITHKRVLKVAGPIVLSNATVPLLGAVDVGVVGQIGEAAPIAAVAMGGIILATVYWIFGFLRMGTAGMVGQAEGAGDSQEVSALLTRALLIAGAGGLALITLQYVIFAGAFALAPVTSEVEALARQYLTIRIWSAPFAISVFAFTGWMVAMERTVGMFYVQLVMNGTNILLSVFFVLGLNLGVPGVAIATVIAEILGAFFGLYLCRSAFENPAWRDWPRIFDRTRLVAMALISGDILVRSALLMAIFTSFVFAGARFGTVTLAANEVLIQFMYITAYAMDGFAFAAEALIARAVGRSDPRLVRRAAVMTSFWGGVTCVSMAVLFAVFGPMLIDVMAKSPEVQEDARRYLWWMIAAPPLGCAAWMFDGIFIGATRGRDMRNMMIVSFIIYVVAVLIFLPTMGNHGLWLALNISFVARGITLGLKYPALERSAAP